MNKNKSIILLTFLFINSTQCININNIYHHIVRHISKKPLHIASLIYTTYWATYGEPKEYFKRHPLLSTLWIADLLCSFNKQNDDLSIINIALLMPYFFTKKVKPNTVISLKQINQQINEGKKNLIQYYEFGEYTNQVELICKQALNNILKLGKPENAAIIFDIDETILTDYYFFKEKNFDWTIQDAFEFRQTGKSKIISPVLEFYKQLISLGYQIIFITSRRDSLYDVTIQNLKDYGVIQYSELILLPMDLFETGIKHDEWKANVRQELSNKYNIVASISDSQKDLEGDNTGYCIKLPNYLY